MRFAGLFLAFCVSPSVGFAECWFASNFRGQTAQADEGYQFTPDTFRDGMLVCFTDETGMVTGNDLPLMRLGNSTLIGISYNERGLEVVNVYQIHRTDSKLLVTQTRIGTATITALLPDYAAVFVGDVVRVPN